MASGPARYMLEEFKRDFANKPVTDYPLSHSFRFGPLVAQAAYNVISTNESRAPKSLVAHEVKNRPMSSFSWRNPSKPARSTWQWQARSKS